jgi:hypothetical protein
VNIFLWKVYGPLGWCSPLGTSRWPWFIRLSLHCTSFHLRSRFRRGIFCRNKFPYMLLLYRNAQNAMCTFTHQFFHGIVPSQCRNNHFPSRISHQISPHFSHSITQNLEHVTFYWCATCIHVHSSRSRRSYSLLRSCLLLNFSTSKTIYSILISILFSLSFLLVGLQRKSGTGYNEMGNTDVVIGLLCARFLSISLTHTHTGVHVSTAKYTIFV